MAKKNLLPVGFLCAVSFAAGVYGTTLVSKHDAYSAPVATGTSGAAEICFSPDEPCEERIGRFLASAQKSVDLAVYDINLEELGELLIAQARKMPVRIVVDKRQSKEKNSIVPMLVQAGVQLRYGHQRGIMHNKFVIVDGTKLETGSFNYTHHASLANQENQIYLSDARAIERYRKRFEQIWEGATPQ
jgi:phosphatidylserine/phosphatidylglycerophosphate/cardiolipin synthase-like enzyme